MSPILQKNSIIEKKRKVNYHDENLFPRNIKKDRLIILTIAALGIAVCSGLCRGLGIFSQILSNLK